MSFASLDYWKRERDALRSVNIHCCSTKRAQQLRASLVLCEKMVRILDGKGKPLVKEQRPLLL